MSHGKCRKTTGKRTSSQPRGAVARDLLRAALSHHRSGRLTQAEAVYGEILEREPDQPDALNLLGVLALQRGEPEAAVKRIRQAIGVRSGEDGYYANLAEALRQLGRGEEAIATYQQALALAPERAEIHYNLGNVYRELGRAAEAVAAYRQAVALKPKFADAHYNLGNALRELGEVNEAIAAYRQVAALQPDDAEALNNLGIALEGVGNLGEALTVYRRALALGPQRAELHYNLGNVYRELGRLGEAMAAYRRALTLRPELVAAQYNLGNTLRDAGAVAEAIAAYRQALTLKPDYRKAHSDLLLCLHYDADTTPELLFAEHRRWAERHATARMENQRAHDNDPTRGRRLRIGYVSPDFRTHSVAFFVEPILREHDRESFEIFCYANVTSADAMTERLRGLADGWRDITPMSDEEVVEQVRADGIDMLVDLSGHTAANRLSVFACKPAPVQIAYLGYPGTRGFAAMDYWLADALADPPGETERYYLEQLVRLPNGFNCYRPPVQTPVPGPLPVSDNGYVTFASFNNANKVGPQVIALWARILQALPEARLLLKASQLAEAEARRRFMERLAEHGISAARVKLLGQCSSQAEHLRVYEQVDIALDPFPYNGHTTTCEALWMGVPVITLAGRTHAGRVGVSLLTHAGLPGLIAQTPEQYVDKALELAGDLERLQALRQGLRKQLQRSPLMDAKGFTRSVEAAYRGMWENYCKASDK